MRIVVIDDSAVFRRRISCLLNLLGHQICGLAENGVIGAEIVSSQHPDAVLLDNEMPDLPGTECIRMIRLSNQRTRIIVLTTGLTPEQTLDLSRSGANAMLLKPVSESKLANLLVQFATIPV